MPLGATRARPENRPRISRTHSQLVLEVRRYDEPEFFATSPDE